MKKKIHDTNKWMLLFVFASDTFYFIRQQQLLKEEI